MSLWHARMKRRKKDMKMRTKGKKKALLLKESLVGGAKGGGEREGGLRKKNSKGDVAAFNECSRGEDFFFLTRKKKIG